MENEGILLLTRLGKWEADGKICQNQDCFAVHGGIFCCKGTLLDIHQNNINLCYLEWKPSKTYNEKVFLFYPST